jgi:hypothetical protein
MSFDWTDEKVSELERLWNEGVTTPEIGRLIGASKNAVIGKAHRLHLPARQSPIKSVSREITDRVDFLVKLGLSTTDISKRVGVSSEFAREKAKRVGVSPPRKSLPALRSLPKEVRVEQVQTIAAGPRVSSKATCQMVLSETGRGLMPLMCGKPAIIKNGAAVWCAECRERVYIPRVRAYEQA